MKFITENVKWTGYIDWDLREFHGYSTPYGTTYNSYLILDEKPTLIDTVKHYGVEEMLARIKETIDPSKIKYIVSNHTEMDHSGSIDKLLELCPEAEIICSPKGEEGLKKHFLSDKNNKNWKFRVVNSGDSLNIGKNTLSFFLTPMVHWPDSMVTYLENNKILFSNDAFGQHYASYERYVDEIGLDIILREATKYYANIVMPYGKQVLKSLEALKKLELNKICPSHGLLWQDKGDIKKILSNYKKWASYESDERVVVIYDTMWHSTEKMALKLFELIDKQNVPVRLINLKNTHISDVVTEIMLSKVVCVGSPILNNKILPSIGGLLTYLRGLKPRNRSFFTFGSYGWSKIGFKEFEDLLKDSGMEQLLEGRYFQFVPSEDDLKTLVDITYKIKEIFDLNIKEMS